MFAGVEYLSLCVDYNRYYNSLELRQSRTRSSSPEDVFVSSSSAALSERGGERKNIRNLLHGTENVVPVQYIVRQGKRKCSKDCSEFCSIYVDF